MRTLLYTLLLAFPALAIGQWTKIETGISSNLTDIHFPTETTGYVVGEGGYWLKTTDGGQNWMLHQMDSTVILDGVHFFTENAGLMLLSPRTGAGDSQILRTEDGGTTWNAVFSIPGYFNLKDIYNLDGQKLYVIGNEIGIGALLLQSDNGGLDWEINAGLTGTNASFASIHFPSEEVGYAVTRGQIYKTTDSGDTWTEIASNAATPDFPFSILETCFFLDENTGYVGGWYDWAFHKTEDGGETWTPMIQNTFLPYSSNNAIQFVDDQEGYAVGWGNYLLHTTNGGNSWDYNGYLADSLDYVFNALQFFESGIGFIVGTGGTLVTNRTFTSSTNITQQPIQISTFPNPVSSRLEIQLDRPLAHPWDLQIINAQGQVVAQQQQIKTNRFSIDVRSLPAGLYTYQIWQSKKQVGKGKIVKQ